MIFIEGKIVDKLVDLAGDDIKYKFSFDLPNGKQHISDFISWKVFRDWACYIMTDSAWLQYDESKDEIVRIIQDEVVLNQLKAEIEKHQKKELRKEIKSDIALHYLPNSTVPDDEEYEEFYEDETCYSDEELDELEERYFW